MLDSEATQGSELLVEAVVTRLVPCAEHADTATGKHVWNVRGVADYFLQGDTLVIQADDAVVVANPNGYQHDCSECQGTPRQVERIPDVRSVQ